LAQVHHELGLGGHEISLSCSWKPRGSAMMQALALLDVDALRTMLGMLQERLRCVSMSLARCSTPLPRLTR